MLHLVVALFAENLCDALLLPTCHFIGHFSVMCQVFSFDQHQLRTFLLRTCNRHQLGDTQLPCHIVTGDYDVFLLNTWRRGTSLNHKSILGFNRNTSDNYRWGIVVVKRVDLKVLLSVLGFSTFPPEHRSSQGRSAVWLCVQVLELMSYCGSDLKLRLRIQ